LRADLSPAEDDNDDDDDKTRPAGHAATWPFKKIRVGKRARGAPEAKSSQGCPVILDWKVVIVGRLLDIVDDKTKARQTSSSDIQKYDIKRR
jgi:hypothetical protein